MKNPDCSFKFLAIFIVFFAGGCSFDGGFNPFGGGASRVDFAIQAPVPTLSISKIDASSTTLEPYFRIEGFSQVGMTAGTLKLLRDADNHCSGGRVVDILKVDTPAETQDLVARYGGFTSLQHSYRVLWTPVSGSPSCSSSLTLPSTGLASGFSKVSLGTNSACALTVGGTVQCWGSNLYGEVGDTTNIKRTTPITVAGLSNIVQLEAGGLFNCVRDNVGTVKCWGYNGAGNLGDGSTTSRTSPVTVTSLPAASLIASGYNHACAIVAGGAVKCWGYNYYGQIGDGTTTNRTAAVDVMDGVVPLTGAVSLALGNYYSCAVMNTGTVKCWGYNAQKQMADGTTTQRNNPVDISGLSGVAAVAAGDNYVCARLVNGTVQCWGATLDYPTDQGLSAVSALWMSGTSPLYFNQGGLMNSGTPAPIPIFLPLGITTPSHFHAGRGNIRCAVQADSRLRCWGNDNINSAGYSRGDRAADAQLALRPVLNNVTDVSSNYYHSCALLADKTIRCWGSNSSGQLGDGTTTDRYTPVNPGLTDVKSVVVGTNNTCAIHTNKTLKCWGKNDVGQLGDNSTTDRLTPVVSTATNVEAVTLGSNHTCAIITGGALHCWGGNANGQLGNGSYTPSLIPVPTSITTATSVAAGYARTCASLANGSVSCWGYGTAGWLGNGVAGNYPTPISNILGAGNGVTKVTSASMHTCALSATSVYCWGQIAALGSGWPTPLTKFFSGGGVPVSLASGYYHGCAVVNDGKTYCWGIRNLGLLGNAELEYANITAANYWDGDTPVLATQIPNAVKIAVGMSTICSLNSSGLLSCLGSSIYGGVGSEINGVDYSSPVNATYVIQR